MRVEIEDDSITARYFTVPPPHEPPETPPRVANLLQLQFKANKLVRRANVRQRRPARRSSPAAPALPSRRRPHFLFEPHSNAAISPVFAPSLTVTYSTRNRDEYVTCDS
jgi:hypothetical protein